MSTPGLPRCRPSRKPALESFVRFRKPSSFSGEQRQVVALDLALADRAVVDEVRLEPEDRLDAVLLARLEQLDRAVHHAVVGEPERRLAELRGAGGELVDLARAVEQRVLGVDVQVGAGGRAHGRRRLDAGSDGAAASRRRPRTLRETPPGQPVRPWARSVQRLERRHGGAIAADRRALAARAPARPAAGARTPRATSTRRRRAAAPARAARPRPARRRATTMCQRCGRGSAISWATVNAWPLVQTGGSRRRTRGRRDRDRGRRRPARRGEVEVRRAASASRSASAPRRAAADLDRPDPAAHALLARRRAPRSSVTTSAATWNAAWPRGRGSRDAARGACSGRC